MKTTKKIFAAVLAVMMIVMMIPFSVSAATTVGVPNGPYSAKYTFVVGEDKAEAMTGDYTFSMFKVADLDKMTAKYTATESFESVQTAINTAKKGAEVLSKADAVEDKGAAVDSKLVSVKGAGQYTIEFKEVKDAGIYLVVCTKKPATVTKAASSLAVLPYTELAGTDWTNDYSYTDENGTVLLNGKLSASKVSVEKKMVDAGSDTNLGFDDRDVTYLLSASITGSADNPLTQFVIVDTINGGLTIDETSFEVYVEEEDTKQKHNVDYKAVSDYKYKDASGSEKTATYGFVIDTKYFSGNEKINDKSFYDYKTVYVSLTANLNESAVIQNALENTDGLVYGNEDGVYYEDGDRVESFTYGAEIFKTQADGTTGLPDAVFTVFEDKNAEKALEVTVNGNTYKVTAKSGADGTAKFVLDGTTTEYRFDADKTYYVKETEAPENYNISTQVFPLTINTSDAYTLVNGKAIPNYPVVVPQTGGMGTMIFYVIGISLIACAVVLLLVVAKRKKSSK